MMKTTTGALAVLGMILSVATADAVTVVSDCSAAGPASVVNKITRLDLPGEDIVLQCALMALPGSDQTRINGASITVDGLNGGSVSSSGKGGQATALVATGSITIDQASIIAANSNGNAIIRAGGNVVVTSGSSISAGDRVEVSCSGPLCTIGIAAAALSGNEVRIEGDGDVTVSPATTITTSCPRDVIRIVSTNGDVNVGGGQIGALGTICCNAVQAVCSQNPNDPACPFSSGGTIVLNDLQELGTFCADCQQAPNIFKTCTEGDIVILAPQGNIDVSNATLMSGEDLTLTARFDVAMQNANISNCGRKKGVIVITGATCNVNNATILDDDPDPAPTLNCGVTNGTAALLGTCASN